MKKKGKQKQVQKQVQTLSFEEVEILIEKYSRLIKNFYGEILSDEYYEQDWKTDGVKIMSYIKIFDVLRNELDNYYNKFKKEGKSFTLSEAVDHLIDIKYGTIPRIEELKKITYYFQVKIKKIGEFKNTYENIISILKKEVENEKKNLNVIQNINHVEKEIRKYMYENNDKTYEKDYNYNYDEFNSIKEVEIGIRLNDDEEKEQKRKEEEEKKKKEEEDKKKEEEKRKKEEEARKREKEMNKEPILKILKNWITNNWFIPFIVLIFFLLGGLFGKI